MGTRHLVCVAVDGDLKIAQYGQWDGYPEGQGLTILDFLRKADYATFVTNLRALRWATDEDHVRISEELGLDDSGWMNSEQADRFNAAYPGLSRDTGAGILDLVAQGVVTYVSDARDFALDSLFCEWAYLIDLDRKVLDVYEGFTQTPTTEGLWAGRIDPDQEHRTDKYYPVRPIASFPFADGLPSDDEFLGTVKAASRYPEDEED